MSELSTAPVKCVIAGKTWKVSRLSVLAIYRCAEEFILDGMARRIEKQAAALPEKERAAFKATEWRELPDGAGMEDKARALLDPAKMPNELAWRILQAGLQASHAKLTLEEASTVYRDGETAEVVNAMQVIAGKAPSPAGPNSAGSRKNTTGRRKR